MSGGWELVIVGPSFPTPRRLRLALGERVVVGRGDEVAISLTDARASRAHVALVAAAEGVLATDLGSSNGTFLGAERLAPRQPRLVTPGTVLRVGAHALAVKPVSPDAAAEVGVRAEYELEQELGRGAYGVVRAARHRASGRQVAIKELQPQGVSPTARERFLREARVRIPCPQVAQVLDLVEEGERLYMVMELVPGRPLDELLAEGPLAIDEALRIGADVARALAAAHALRIVHRDIKPSNVLIATSGEVKVIDFGIAKELGNHMTLTGHGLGTLDYVAPEQAEDAKHVGPGADLYALGATLYRMIGGRPPLDSTQPGFFDALFEAAPPPLTALRPECPPAVAGLVARLLEKEPEDRGANAATVARALDQLRGGAAA